MIFIFIYTAGGVLSLNYEGILTRFGALVVYLAIGEVSRGKTIAAKLVVAACCNYISSRLSADADCQPGKRSITRGAAICI